MKNNFTLKSIFTVLVLLCSVNSYSQERACGMVEYMEEQMQNPEFAKEYEKNQEKFKVKLQQMLSEEDFSQRGTTIEIPVAVHFPAAIESDRACLEALAQNQIDIINNDYTATNADISLWTAASPFYPNTNVGVAAISFCLAVSNHPVGLDPELIEGNPAITIGYDFGGGSNVDGNWGGYMNFVVRPISALGFSPLGGSIAAGEAVTISTIAFGSGAGCSGSGIVPGAPYNLGRTVTHELGHFYNLDHIFGSCSTDDGIADTPNQNDPNGGCPTLGNEAACDSSEQELFQNYMDYTNDACMFMFSEGQATVVDTWVSLIASQIKPDVCTPAVPGFNITANNSPLLSCPATDTEAIFDLSYITIQGFNEPTTFTASGAPAGATLAFSSNPLSADDDFTMTIGNLGATAQGEYTITVTGTSSPGAIVETVDVLLKNTCTAVVCNSYDSPENLGLVTLDPSGGNPGVVGDDINIPDSAIIESMTVNVDLSHTWIGDVLLQLQHPNGVDFMNLWVNECAGENDLDITFDDTAGAIVCAEPTVGVYAPNGSLSTFNGLDAQGDWTLIIADFGPGDTGVLNDWSITICSEQALNTEEFLVENFSIFPNPNDGEFTVKLNSNSGNDINIDVFDIRGRRIFNNSYTNGSEFAQTIALNNVKSGIYLVTVTDGNNKTTKKIIVE